MKKTILRFLYTFILFINLPFISFGQVDTYKYHSIFIYQFTKYIEWPSNSGEFVIGVLGDSPIIAELEQMARTKSTPDRKFKIKKLNSVAAVLDCKLVFVCNSRSNDLAKILSMINTKPILIVSEKEGDALRGSHMNLIFESGKLKMEMNRTRTLLNGFKVSSELIKFATIVA